MSDRLRGSWKKMIYYLLKKDCYDPKVFIHMISWINELLLKRQILFLSLFSFLQCLTFILFEECFSTECICVVYSMSKIELLENLNKNWIAAPQIVFCLFVSFGFLDNTGKLTVHKVTELKIRQ